MASITATEFKAKCLEFLDRVGEREMDSLSITKHGKVVAVLVPPPAPAEAVDQLYGSMRGSVIIPDGFDLTAPVFDGTINAEDGILHL